MGKENMEFEDLLKAMQEAYPKDKCEYVDFDVYLRDVMIRFAEKEKAR